MTTHDMLDIVRKQLAIDLNCKASDLEGERDGFVFAEAKDHPARRPFLRGEQYFEMLTMGGPVVVSATPKRLQYAREQLHGKSRDQAFALPFIRGHVIHFLPDIEAMKCIGPPPGFLYELAQRDQVAALRGEAGFGNAIQNDADHPVQNTLALVAKRGDTMAGIAGAFWWSADMRGIGFDVKPEYRRKGLAAYLVNALTVKLLLQDIVPVYAVNACNIASQRVAHRAGYVPAWISDWRVQFEGELRNQ